MDKPMLKTGDPCPCCGQPIKTSDPAILAVLTHIRDAQFFDFGIGKEDNS